jgi:hypothetical protein
MDPIKVIRHIHDNEDVRTFTLEVIIGEQRIMIRRNLTITQLAKLTGGYLEDTIDLIWRQMASEIVSDIEHRINTSHDPKGTS